MNELDWKIIRKSMIANGLSDKVGDVEGIAKAYFQVLADLGISNIPDQPVQLGLGLTQPAATLSDLKNGYLDAVNRASGLDPGVFLSPPPPPPVVDPQAKHFVGQNMKVPSLSLTSSISSSQEVTETVDELYERVLAEIPDTIEAVVPNAGTIKIAVDVWRKYDERSDSIWTVDSVGLDISLADDRSTKIGKTIYYPGKEINVRGDIDDIVASFVKRVTPGGQRVIAKAPPPSPGFGDYQRGMFAGNYAGGINDAK